VASKSDVNYLKILPVYDTLLLNYDSLPYKCFSMSSASFLCCIVFYLLFMARMISNCFVSVMDCFIIHREGFDIRVLRVH